jgi:hypothetical protein
MICGFDMAWVGPCKAENCTEHAALKCVSCGAKATRSCDETGQFVCGAPLCPDCEHTLAADGTNGGVGFNAQRPPEGMGHHCKKTEQKHKPWYAQEATA